MRAGLAFGTQVIGLRAVRPIGRFAPSTLRGQSSCLKDINASSNTRDASEMRHLQASDGEHITTSALRRPLDTPAADEQRAKVGKSPGPTQIFRIAAIRPYTNLCTTFHQATVAAAEILALHGHLRLFFSQVTARARDCTGAPVPP